MAKLVCPECGKDLTGLDLKAHAISHWPEYIAPTPENKGALQRRAELLALEKSTKE